MATDPAIRDHQAWLGYLQPDGLVVSPAALVDSQVVVDRSATSLQQRFQTYVQETERGEDTIEVIKDLAVLLREFLEWPAECLFGPGGQHPLPESLKIPLQQFGETLEPRLAFQCPRPENPDHHWLLLVQEIPAGVDLDQPIESAMVGWSASHTRRFERLLREAGVPIGLISNGTHLRLLYAPRGENAGTLTFPVSAMTEVAGRPILAALHMLLCRYRLLAAPSEACLPALLKRSRDYQARVSTTLAQQVLDALYDLLRGFQAAHDRTKGQLLTKVLADDPNQVYSGLLTVLMRLVFLLYAEDRGLMPGSDLYVRNYSIHGLFEKLRADAEQYQDTMEHRYGAWAQMLSLFRIVHDGCLHPMLKMPARHGHLFDPDRFPFLEGRTGDTDDSHPHPLPLVPDGTIYRVLAKLLILEGQRLSYRTLDVEQIGSVYETMMGFRLELAGSTTIALKPAKAHGAPVPLNLEELLATPAKDRAKFIADRTDYDLPTTMGTAVKAADTIDGLLAGLERRIARSATPQPVPAGSMVLMPTDERRKTGSHYTPRTLTGPIVRKALEPVLAQLGEHSTPDDILNLKVCDPAMGSGAFLVEVCRQLADHLVAAWAFHGYKPRIPEDEDEVLYARRLVAQRCLYGVDRNPMAVDLAKLSLWLATLAKDHPFTFLNHALRAGDSLVGLTRLQIAYFNLAGSGEPTFVQGRLHEQITNAIRARGQILAAGDDMPPAAKAQKLAVADEALEPARLAGDLFVASFFNGSKSRDRQENRDRYLALLDAWKRNLDANAQGQIQTILVRLRDGRQPVTPFHWEIEFPEVFGTEKCGFDAIVGNPPFMGGSRISGVEQAGYLDYLKEAHERSHGNADLVAHFFRRSFDLIHENGAFGLIATNTIGQGDTRSTGLSYICTHGGTIFAARKRYRWPGRAAVVVSVVHVYKGKTDAPATLDGREVTEITAYLLHTGGHDDPARLDANKDLVFNGVKIYGQGFCFDDDDPLASPLAEMERLARSDPRNSERIFPYIGGQEINDDPRHAYRRFVINFDEWPLERRSFATTWSDATAEQRRRFLTDGLVPLDYPGAVAADYPEMLKIVETRVKPERMLLRDTADGKQLKKKWWLFGRSRPEMRSAINGLSSVMVACEVGPHLSLARLPANWIFAHTTKVFALSSPEAYCILQSRVHELWARVFSSSMKDDLRYTPSDCFETFPFPEVHGANQFLETAGREYYEYRAALMTRNNEGLTKTYNRFHDPNETSPDILRLRNLHTAMDRAVLDAYDWKDNPTDCQFLLDYEDEDEDDEAVAPRPRSRKKPWRYRWPDEVRDEVLARLLKMNAERAEEERRTGQAAAARKSTKNTRGRKTVAASVPGLFAEPSKADAFEPVPMLEAVELMVAILDALTPAKVQQVAAERIFILAVNQQVRERYEQAEAAPANVVSEPGAPFRVLWQTVTAMEYATISDSRMVTRTDQAIALTNPEHARMARNAVSLFKKGEAMKRSWPVEVDNVQYIVS